MNILDIIILICFIPAVIAGLRKGLIGQVIGLLTLILGCRFAYLLQEPVTKWLSEVTAGNPELIKIASFILIFIAVAVILFLLGKVIEGFIRIILLNWLNRLLGVIISSVIAIIVFGIIGITVTSLNNELHLFDPAVLQASVLLEAFQKFTVTIMPYLKSLIF